MLYPRMSGLAVTGAGCPPHLDGTYPKTMRPGLGPGSSRTSPARARSADSWEDAVYILKQMLVHEDALDALQAAAIETFIGVAYAFMDYLEFHDWLAMVLDEAEQALAVPVDYITLPNAQDAQGYTYYGSGALSWATGYLAGLAALGVQVKPDVTEEILELLWDTATPFGGSTRLVNPAGFIDSLAGSPEA